MLENYLLSVSENSLEIPVDVDLANDTWLDVSVNAKHNYYSIIWLYRIGTRVVRLKTCYTLTEVFRSNSDKILGVAKFIDVSNAISR